MDGPWEMSPWEADSSPLIVIILLLFGALVDSILRRASRPAKSDKEQDDRDGSGQVCP